MSLFPLLARGLLRVSSRFSLSALTDQMHALQASDGCIQLKTTQLLALYSPPPPCKTLFHFYQSPMHLYSTSTSEEHPTVSKRKVLPTFELNKDWGKRFSEVDNVLGLTRILNGTRTMKDRLDSTIKAAILGRSALVLRDFELNPSVLREIEIDVRELLEKEREKISSNHLLICTLMDSVRRLLDTHRHFKTSPSLEFVDSACSYMTDVWRIMIHNKNQQIKSTVLRMSRPLMEFLLVSMIHTSLSAEKPYGPKLLESFEIMISLALHSLRREARGQVLLSLFPPKPHHIHYQLISSLLLNLGNFRQHDPPKPTLYQSLEGLFLLPASFANKDNPVLLEKHRRMLDLVSRGHLIWSPYPLLLLLSLRGQGLSLPSPILSQAAEAVKSSQSGWDSQPFIRGLQRGEAMQGVGYLQIFLWSEGIEGLQVMSSQANMPGHEPYSQEDLAVLMKWARGGLERVFLDKPMRDLVIDKSRSQCWLNEEEEKADKAKPIEEIHSRMASGSLEAQEQVSWFELFKRQNGRLEEKETMESIDSGSKVKEVLARPQGSKASDKKEKQIKKRKKEAQAHISQLKSSKDLNEMSELEKETEEAFEYVYVSTGSYFGQVRAAKLLYSYVRGQGKHPWILNLLCDQIYPYN